MKNNTVNISMDGGCGTQKPESQKNFFDIPDGTTVLDKVMGVCKEPADVDKRAAELGLDPITVNPYFATVVDYRWTGVIDDGCVRLPVPFTGKPGRTSIFYLKTGESTQDALLVSRKGIFYSVVTRVSGRTDRGAVGDEYEFSIRDGAGRVIAKSIGKLAAVNNTDDGIFNVPDAAKSDVQYVYECRRKSKIFKLKYVISDEPLG